jgi:hypothetical protein
MIVIVDGDLGKTMMNAIMACFKLLTQHLPATLEGRYEKSLSGSPTFGTIIKLGISPIPNTNAKRSTVTYGALCLDYILIHV